MVSLSLNELIINLGRMTCITRWIKACSILGSKPSPAPMPLLYPPLQRSWKGGILVSPCPSVRLWTESCPLCIFNNTHRIHFIFAHLINSTYQATSEGVSCVMLVSKFKILKFWRIFKIFNFDFVFFWLGIQYDSIEWVIMRRLGGILRTKAF